MLYSFDNNFHLGTNHYQGDGSYESYSKKIEIGEYEARFFLNNSFTVEDSISFTIVNALKTYKEEYEINDIPVWIQLNAYQPNNESDWIGIYPKGSTNDWANMVSWVWASDTSITQNGETNWYKFEDPDSDYYEGDGSYESYSKKIEIGEYEARFFLNNSFTVSSKIDFIVKENSNLLYPPTTTLTTRPTDQNVIQPNVGESFIDNVFQTKVTRVTEGNDLYHTDLSYPKVQSWNKDMSLLRIGYRIYDGKTFEETSLTKEIQDRDALYLNICSPIGDYFRWSNVDSTKFYVLNSSKEFLKGEILNNTIECHQEDGGTKIVLDPENKYEKIEMGPGEGNIDYSDKYVVFAAKERDKDEVIVLTLNIQTGEMKEPKVLNGTSWGYETLDDWEKPHLDWITISPSGKHILVNRMVDYNTKENKVFIYDIDMNNERVLADDGGHGDIGFDMNGQETYVQFESGTAMYAYNLDNLADNPTKVLNLYGGGHVSCRNTQRQGWCYITTDGEDALQIFALKLDGTDSETVQLFTQTHLQVDEFASGGVSPDGTHIIFQSDWEGTRDFFDVYVAQAN